MVSIEGAAIISTTTRTTNSKAGVMVQKISAKSDMTFLHFHPISIFWLTAVLVRLCSILSALSGVSLSWRGDRGQYMAWVRGKVGSLSFHKRRQVNAGPIFNVVKFQQLPDQLLTLPVGKEDATLNS